MASHRPDGEEAHAPKRRRLVQAFANNRQSITQRAQQIPENLELTSGAPSTRENRERVTEQWTEYAHTLGLRYVTELFCKPLLIDVF
jgi:hypothetical protein